MTSTNPKRAKPPDHLSKGSQALWSKLVADYALAEDDAALAILTAALEARDRAEQARKLLDTEGLTVPGDRGDERPILPPPSRESAVPRSYKG